MTKNRDDNKDSAPPPAAHILVVDDHIEIRDLVSRALLKDGFRVSTAADGNAMRQALVNNEIDLIVLDLMMPGDDGLTGCAVIDGAWYQAPSCLSGMRHRRGGAGAASPTPRSRYHGPPRRGKRREPRTTSVRASAGR